MVFLARSRAPRKGEMAATRTTTPFRARSWETNAIRATFVSRSSAAKKVRPLEEGGSTHDVSIEQLYALSKRPSAAARAPPLLSPTSPAPESPVNQTTKPRDSFDMLQSSFRVIRSRLRFCGLSSAVTGDEMRRGTCYVEGRMRRGAAASLPFLASWRICPRIMEDAVAARKQDSERGAKKEGGRAERGTRRQSGRRAGRGAVFLPRATAGRAGRRRVGAAGLPGRRVADHLRERRKARGMSSTISRALRVPKSRRPSSRDVQIEPNRRSPFGKSRWVSGSPSRS